MIVLTTPEYSFHEVPLDVMMHKAISVIQFKIEGQIIKKNPGFKMEDRNLLHAPSPSRQ